jgi:hypothetical protein
MGRPLKKDILGNEVLNTPVSASGITCDFYDGSTNQTDGIIIKQRGANSFVVARIGTPGTTFVCKLVDTTPNAAGEMRIQGSTTGNLDTGLVPIAKLTKRIAYGFPSSPVLSDGFYRGEDGAASTNHDQTRYTWYLENDSSADYIVLTSFTTQM